MPGTFCEFSFSNPCFGVLLRKRGQSMADKNYGLATVINDVDKNPGVPNTTGNTEQGSDDQNFEVSL